MYVYIYTYIYIYIYCNHVFVIWQPRATERTDNILHRTRFRNAFPLEPNASGGIWFGFSVYKSLTPRLPVYLPIE